MQVYESTQRYAASLRALCLSPLVFTYTYVPAGTRVRARARVCVCKKEEKKRQGGVFVPEKDILEVGEEGGRRRRIHTQAIDETSCHEKREYTHQCSAVLISRIGDG